MAHKFGVSVEHLERRTLLTIAYTLTTDQSVYQAGQPIQLAFTETNTGTQPVTVSLSPSDFTVSEQSPEMNGPVWESNPENDGQPPTSVTLQPGQSVSQTATWDGTVTEPAIEPGTVTSYAVNQFGTFAVSNPSAPEGDTATFQITNPLQGTLTTSQAVYQLGQPVQVTFAETNTSDQAVSVRLFDPVLYRLLRNGQQVTPVMDPEGKTYETIGPGQTAQHQFTVSQAEFDGFSGNPENLTGTLAVQVYAVAAAPGEFTADLQIAVPPAGTIVSSVTTNQPVYQAGETVTMTFTETNTGDQAVMVPAGLNGFAFNQISPASYSDIPLLPGPTMTGWTTLEPGQSWTQTETWPVIHPVSGPYTVQISNDFDPNGNTSTFEVAGASTSGNLTVTTPHSAFTLGKSVRITVTIAGTSATKAVSSREQITVLGGTQVVSRLTRRIPASKLKRLEAGHSITLTNVWNGRPSQPGIHALKPGSYAIDVTYGDSSGQRGHHHRPKGVVVRPPASSMAATRPRLIATGLNSALGNSTDEMEFTLSNPGSADEAHTMVRSANLDFFAAEADQRALLDFLFGSTDVRVFESYSEFDADLREFRSTDDLASAFPLGSDPHGSGAAILLILWSPSVSRKPDIVRIDLIPEKCGGATFRYSIDGEGLMLLYFGGVCGQVITKSNFAHASSLWAEREGLKGIDWEAYKKLSNRIQYHIRKRLAVGKVRSIPVLPEAMRLAKAGYALKQMVNSPFQYELQSDGEAT